MTINVTNHTPAVLEPVHTIPCTGPYDPISSLDAQITNRLSAPLNAGVPVNITVDGQDVTDDLPSILLKCLADNVDPDSEELAKSILGATVTGYQGNTPLPINELFADLAGRQRSLPAPTPTVIYTSTGDVLPAAQAMDKNPSAEHAQEFFASVAYTFHPNTLGFWFADAQAFAEFKGWFLAQATSLGAALPPRTLQLCRDFCDTTTLSKLTESLRLRCSEADSNEPFSFARLVVNLLMTYIKNQPAGSGGIGLMPFTVNELFCPQTLVLVNIQRHASASSARVNAEWRMITQSIASPVKILSNKKISQLTTVARAINKAAATRQTRKQDGKAQRSINLQLRGRPPKDIELYNAISRRVSRMGFVNRSQNAVARVSTTFQRPSRRDPDDVNRPGRIISHQYVPDIHLYVDNSGSISEKHFRDCVLIMIKLAKKLDINLYISTFSHVLSQPTLLQVKGRSVSQIYQAFMATPKVTGMTDYQQIWDYINASAERSKRFSLVLTDFEWSAPNTRETHPKNLFYAPCSAMDWQNITYYATNFVRSMQHIDPATGQRLLGMVQ